MENIISVLAGAKPVDKNESRTVELAGSRYTVCLSTLTLRDRDFNCLTIMDSFSMESVNEGHALLIARAFFPDFDPEDMTYECYSTGRGSRKYVGPTPEKPKP